MWRYSVIFLRKLNLWCYRGEIVQALALYRRGEVRRDGLTADHVRSRLKIRWRARGIHPRDRYRARDEREALFVEQALTDTEAAVLRLFERLPQVDVIEVSILEPTSGALIATGTVHRSALNATRPPLLSVGMRLRELGIAYCFAARDKSP
jgi:hypothetical protein